MPLLNLTRPRALLALILLASFLLRLALILQGGAHYWPDERRYRMARLAVDAAAGGDIRQALGYLHGADHMLFKVIGLIPAAVERLTVTGPVLPLLFFSLFSVLNIWLLWRIARRLGASEGEATAAAFCFSLAASFFYFSRHLVPYDVSASFGLLALLVALREPARLRDACYCGLLSCGCLLTYNGHWALSGFALVAAVLRGWPAPLVLVRRAAIAGACLLAPFLALIGLSALLGGDLLAQYIRFSGLVTQGSFAEGALVPFTYLWHAEHGILLFWLVCLGRAAWHGAHGGMNRRIAVGLGGAVFIYGMLAASSSGLQLFVVYGRLARQVAPFLCLVAGHELYRLAGARGRLALVYPVLCAALLAQAAWNFYTPLTQVFPREFKARARAIAGERAPAKTELRYAGHIFPGPEAFDTPPGPVLLEARHPLQYLPYQYEGYSPDQRAALRETDISMRLYAVSSGSLHRP